MKVTATVNGVGKFKPKFGSTGLLIDAGKGEFWTDIKGQLDYRDYKGKTVTVDIEKNDKGYWGGTLVSGGPKVCSVCKTATSIASGGNKDRLIVTQVVYKALMEKGEPFEEGNLVNEVDMIMRVGAGKIAEPETTICGPLMSDPLPGGTPALGAPSVTPKYTTDELEPDNDIPF